MTTQLIPFLHPGPGGPPLLLGGLVSLLLGLALLGGLLLLLSRRGRLGPPPAFFRSPEHDARTTLANRFANGDIATEEFLERASVLNWTPGVHDPVDPDRRPPRR